MTDTHPTLGAPVEYTVVFDGETYDNHYTVKCTGGPQKAAQIAFEDNFCDDADAQTYGVDTLVLTPNDEKFLFSVKAEEPVFVATQIRTPLPEWAVLAHCDKVSMRTWGKKNKR